ncbi:sensor histidine kinase [Dactylosporangium darangshiense]|uniref:histidine kinase n=1 Tax=Dactylosporangium darangshiense TaxID=579108 RepID=A0ABP8DF44_9ACTN
MSRSPMRSLVPRRWSLATRLLALQLTIITVVVSGSLLGAYVQADHATLDAARQKVLGVAWSVADSPAVRAGLAAPDPTAVLLPVADAVAHDTATDFVVVMTRDGIRYTHPDRRQIGGHFLGTIDQAQRGRALTETFTGTLGPSMRAVVPVLDGGRVVGLVSVGIKLQSVARTLRGQLPTLLVTGALALLVAAAGSWLVSRWLRRETHDLGPAELARLFEFYDAVLHAVREGLLLLDREGRLLLANDEANRLLDLDDAALGRPVGAAGLPTALGQALATGQPRTDEIHLAGDRVLVINQAPAGARPDGAPLGTVVTLRDHTDLQALAGELDSVRGFAESLRAQAHEAANRLHTVLSLIELGRPEQALDFAAQELAVAQGLTDRVVGAVREPVLAALLLGKASEASERGVDLAVSPDADVPEALLPARDLVTIVGNLLDNAIDAALAAPPPRRVEFAAAMRGDELVLRVADSGPGLDPADVARAFERGWSTKPAAGPAGRGLGLALVGQAVRRHGGDIDIEGSAFTVRVRRTAAIGAVT